jgi:hypothetical protein
MNRSLVFHGSFGALVAAGALLALTGCTHARANTTPEMPGLEVPPPPPKAVEPTESEPPQPVPLVKEPARHTPVQAPRQSRPPAEPVRPEAPRTEPPKIETVPPADMPKIEEAPHPPTTLQTTPSQAEGEVERSIRIVLTKASNDLNRVDYRGLNADARTQYDQAKRFVQQADEALKAKNLVFARNLADKAATMAAQLAGR